MEGKLKNNTNKEILEIHGGNRIDEIDHQRRKRIETWIPTETTSTNQPATYKSVHVRKYK